MKRTLERPPERLCGLDDTRERFDTQRLPTERLHIKAFVQVLTACVESNYCLAILSIFVHPERNYLSILLSWFFTSTEAIRLIKDGRVEVSK